MRWKVPCLVLILVGGVSGCSASSAQPQELLVFAASSLTDAFGEIEQAFEAVHADIDVVTNFAGSSSLREQIVEGAPAAVFASASGSIMNQIVEADANSGDPAPFATNRLQIVVPAGNPGGVSGLDNFANDDLLIGLCAEGVPCGDFAREALTMAGVQASVDTFESDVRALLTKVAAGELDAGIVYVTDVMSAGNPVEGIDIPEEINVVVTYPITVLAAAPDREAASTFMNFVLSRDGQRVLRAFGFGPP